tara:strand:- start:3 stop:365 length:363 start_codon:yes stop_codon:yes gene_type:complete
MSKQKTLTQMEFELELLQEQIKQTKEMEQRMVEDLEPLFVEEEKLTFFKLRLKKKEQPIIYFLYNNKIHLIEQRGFGYKPEDVEIVPMDKNGKHISDLDESLNIRKKVINSMFGSDMEVS